MAVISIDDVKKVAKLSGLTLSDAESETYSEQFNEILGYIDRLAAVDTKGVEPTYQVTGLVNIMREDVVIDYKVDQAGLLSNTPDTEAGQLKVKRVLA